MEAYLQTLQRCGIFDHIPEKHYSCALTCLKATRKDYPAGAFLADVGQPVQNAGVLLEGAIEQLLYDENGNQSTLRYIRQGEIFGAELAVGEVCSAVSLRAVSDCSVLLLSFGALLSPETMTCPYRMQVTANLMKDFARQVLAFNTKIRILSQKRLRDRLKIYLQTLTPAADGSYHLPCTRSELAEFLCVDRSALSRELCRMRDEGLLRFSGAKLELLDPHFLD